MFLSCSAKATDEYEAARKKIADFIKAPTDREIVFTRNASEAINLVAYTWGLTNLKEGDEVIYLCGLFFLAYATAGFNALAQLLKTYQEDSC